MTLAAAFDSLWHPVLAQIKFERMKRDVYEAQCHALAEIKNHVESSAWFDAYPTVTPSGGDSPR